MALTEAATFVRLAHAHTDVGEADDALVYLGSALSEVDRLLRACRVPRETAQVERAAALIQDEIKALRAYQQLVADFDATPFGEAKSAAPSPPLRDVVPPRSAHHQQAGRPSVLDAPGVAPRSRASSARPGACAPGHQRRPPPDWRKSPDAPAPPARGRAAAPAAAKVDSRRPKAGPKAPAAPEAQPWDEWTGQDRELAANLADDIMEASPGIRWDDIAGLADAKRILQEAMVLPLLRPELFVGIRKPVKGVLLFGPPGTGKTLLAKALATECETTFFAVSSSTLASKWRGESERMVRVMFAMARAKAPATIFIDEVDSLCSSRGGGGDNDASRRVKTEILVQINGIQSGDDAGGRVMVMGATNFPWDLDEALRRRLEKRIYIPLPGHNERKELFRINIKGVDVAPDCDFDDLSKLGEGYSGDDITNICRDAAMNGLRRAIEGKELSEIKQMHQDDMQEPIRMLDFEQAFAKIKPSVGKDDLVRHEKWREEYGST